MPTGRKPTYGKIVVNKQSEKKKNHQTRLTVKGNLIDYRGDKSTATADIITAKILFNSILSTKEARLLGLDISNFSLNTPMSRYEYMKIPIEIIPTDIVLQYKLLDKVRKGFVYIEIRKGMYDLPQAGEIANDLLKNGWSHMNISHANACQGCEGIQVGQQCSH